MKNETIQLPAIPPSSLWAGGLLTVSLIILQSFLSIDKDKLDILAVFSVCLFALAIPILVYKILINILRQQRYDTRTQSVHRAVASLKTPFLELVFFILGAFSALAGIALALWRIHWIAMLIFSVSTIIGLLCYFRHT